MRPGDAVTTPKGLGKVLEASDDAVIVLVWGQRVMFPRYAVSAASVSVASESEEAAS